MTPLTLLHVRETPHTLWITLWMLAGVLWDVVWVGAGTADGASVSATSE